MLFARLERAAAEVGVDFIGGFSALVHKGTTPGDGALIDSIPEALARTERVCSSSTSRRRAPASTWTPSRAWARSSCATAQRTADRDGIGCAKLVVFCNAVEDNPFMAGAFLGIGEPECVVNVGVCGPGVVANAVEAEPNADFGALAETSSSAPRSRSRAWASSSAARLGALGVPFGIVDVSLAPTPALGDCVARVLKRSASSAPARPARRPRSRC